MYTLIYQVSEFVLLKNPEGKICVKTQIQPEYQYKTGAL